MLVLFRFFIILCLRVHLAESEKHIFAYFVHEVDTIECVILSLLRSAFALQFNVMRLVYKSQYVHACFIHSF